MTAQSMLYVIKIMLFHEDWVSYFVLCKNSSACDESWNTYVHIHLVGFRFNHFIKTLHSNKLLCQQSIDFIYLTLLLIANILQLLYVCVCVCVCVFFHNEESYNGKDYSAPRTTCNSLLDRSSIWQIYNECGFTETKVHVV